MDFFYDASGYPFAVKYNGDLCYYITNLQGDVMSIVDAQGEVVAEYEYDPYGNIVSQSGPLADVNPLRYRGYVYDTETGFYYLQSRYYDSELGRFINADSYASTGQGVLGNNMFTYCNNNPVVFKDETGHALKPNTVAINDGGYKEIDTHVDDYPLSIDLANRQPTPESDETVISTIRRNGYYTYDPYSGVSCLLALGGLAALLTPFVGDEIAWWGAFCKAVTCVGILGDIATVLGLPSTTQIYDRYSITQTWVTEETVGGRCDIRKTVTHYSTSYYYWTTDESGGVVWHPCGTTYSYMEQFYPIP